MKNFKQLTTALNVAKASTTTNKKGFCKNDGKSFLCSSILLIICLVFMLLPVSKAQVSMVDRPQAVNHQTNTMQLDGLFDVSLGLQRICVYIRNDGTVPITNVTATASFNTNSGIILTDSIETFGTLMPGVAVMGFYTANFSGSYPDKHLLSLQVTGTSFSQSVSRHLFVLKSINIDSSSWISYLPEGSIKTQILTDHYNGTLATLGMPKDFIWTVNYKTPFTGQYGPIAFNDPWWKVAGAITGVVGGLTYVAGGIVKYCGNEKEGELVKDIGTGVGGAGAIVAAADSIDVFRRGQQNTMPLPNEFTLKEEVDMHVNYAPNAGIGVHNYSAQVTWNYKRFTTGNTYLYTETETVYNNIHFTTSRTTTINNTNFNTNNQIVVTASVNGFQGIQNNKGYFIANMYPGNQTKLNQLVRSVVMRDDGHNGDITAADGIYTALTPAAGLLTNQPMGIYILGYDRNNAPDNIDPLQAAIEIGGVLISTPNLNGCEIIADYMIMVMSPININITTLAASCYNANNGSATAVAVGGTAPYTYLWSNGQTTANINNLAPGTYTVTVTSANGQSGVQFTTVNQPKLLPVEATIEPPFCNTSGTGSINITVNNFTPPLSFLWFDGITASSRSNLLPGAYTVTVTDGAGACFSEVYELQANTPYLMQCPTDITVHTLPGHNYAIVNYDIDITNGCQNFITYNLHPPSGTWFNKGVHTVTCQAVDALGDTSQCIFTVYVNDPEAPQALIKDTTLTLNTQGILTLNPALLSDSSFDNCGIVSSEIAPNILTCSNIGITPVTLTVYDGNNYYWHILTNSIAYYNNGNSLINTISTTANAGVIVCRNAGFIVTDQDRVRLYNSQGDLLVTIFTLGKVTVTLTGDGGFIVTDDGRVRKYDSEGNLQSTIFTTGVVQVITLGDCGFIVVDEGRVRKYD
ncbi:MAG: hypothetical protein JNK61_11185, partial [Bacteroidia bacterium]|nr:hypothetical protein [Bacteroidia bacterium]